MRSKRCDNGPDYRNECQYCFDDTSECCGYCDSPIGRSEAFCTCCGAPTGRSTEILVQDDRQYECGYSDDDCCCERYHGRSKVLRLLSVFFPQTVMYFVGVWNGKGTKRHKVVKICAVIGAIIVLSILGMITS